MFRATFADFTMHFLLLVLLLFYPVNSLSDVSINNTRAISPPISNETTTPPMIPHVLEAIPHVLNEKVKSVIITSTEETPIETRNETKLDFKESVLKLLNKPPVIGRTCKNNTDCSADKNSVCLNGICQCETDFVAAPNNKSCLPKAKALEDDCLENVQCDSIYGVSGLAVCASFRCVCSGNAVLINNRCYRKTLLGKACREDSECKSIQYSYCFQSVCACDPDFFPDDSGTQCFPFTNGTSNMTNINCKSSSSVCKILGEDAYCSNDTCVCYPGYHLSMNLCVKEKNLGEFCESNSDCEVDMKPEEKPGTRVCKKNKCACGKGYKELREHNVCQSGSTLSQSLLLILGSLFFLLK